LTANPRLATLIMPTPSQIDEQVRLERDQIKQGINLLNDNTKSLEKKSYSSSSIYGITSIRELLPIVTEEIESCKKLLKRGHNGVAFKEVHQYIENVDSGILAAITCKVLIDKVFSTKDKSNYLSHISSSIGSAVEDECHITFYETTVPGLLNHISKNYWHKACGTHQRIVVLRTLMNRYGVETWKRWNAAVRVRLGTWLLHRVMSTCNWFEKKRIHQAGSKFPTVIVPTEEYLAIKEKIMQDAELFAPLAYPMYIEPNDWTNERKGGYLLNEVMRGHHLVRQGEVGIVQGELPLRFLNKIQKVGYRINPFTYEIAQELLQRGIAVGKFIPIVEIPMPVKPFDIDHNKESRKSYCRETAEAKNKQALVYQASCRTRKQMEAARLFINRKRFFIPWNYDWRGRCYPIPTYLTVQDTDFGKSLLNFADAAEVTEESKKWIEFQVATTYGLDKATISERLEWARNNHALITRIATDPIGNLSEWEGVEEPWQFVSACDEMYHCIIKGDRKTTRLMIAIDATASGIQILSGLCKDKQAAMLCNVLPSDEPVDAYKIVAEESKPQIPVVLHPHWDRKCTKRTVMTIPYNAKPFSNRTYIKDALKEKGVEITKDDLTQTVTAVRDAMEIVIPGPMALMRWIEKEVSKTIRRGVEKVQWVTPSGFVVSQRYMKKEVVEIKMKLLGRCEIRVATDDSNEVDILGHKNGTAPNLIHSLDADTLRFTVDKFDKPIALIHDSVLCRATDMTELSVKVREAYRLIFTEHDYINDFAKAIGAESEPPIIGDLVPSDVINSTYFFC